MRILILYGTSEGHTQKIATFVGDLLARRGHLVTTVDVVHRPTALRVADFDATIIAARVHAGLYQSQLVRLVESNRRTLAAMPNAFLSVSMSAANLQPGDLERAKRYVDSFIRRTGWQPRVVVQVAGARLYTRHSAISRWILGLVDRKAFDTSKDHVWTDWDALGQFADDFAEAAARVEVDLEGTHAPVLPIRST